MTYEKTFADAKKALLKSATNIGEDFAIQFNIVGEGEGYFYAEVKDGVLSVEPYDYNDRNAVFASDAATIIKLTKGTLTAKAAMKKGVLYVESIATDEMVAAFDALFTAPKTAKKETKAAAPKAAKTAAPKAPKAAAPKAPKAAAPKAPKAAAPKAAKAAAPKAAKAAAVKAPKANTPKNLALKSSKNDAPKASTKVEKSKNITIGDSKTETVKVELPKTVVKPAKK